MTTERSTSFKHRYLGWAALFIAPAMLGARGCHVAVVGSECGGLRGEQCDSGEYCDFGADAACGAADQTGTCERIPEQCTAQQDPVCGCDGVSYGNACSAHASGVSVANKGECGSGGGDICGGLLGAQCADGEFCNFPADASCGAADQTGTCDAVPEACDDIFAPVCGCDDHTYGNDCEAHRAGTSVVHEGACDATAPTGSVCGGLLGAQCADGEFCNFPLDAICGAADGTGTCDVIPEACDDVLLPVCSCDGVTYGNACEANAAGKSVASQGACDGDGGGSGSVCGGRGGAACADGEFCNFAPAAICGAADASGTCAAIPQACTREFNPVCSCDGVTYANACEAHAAGKSVARDGACEGDGAGAVCGGLLGAQCNDGEFCNFSLDAICGAADATGTCEAVPQACTREFNPVCGCDGVTYSNACVAHAAGQSAASEGACPPAQSGGACGGLLGATCPDAEFCSFAADAFCGAADQTGVCTPRPEACTQIFDPVCGCDGMTYGNACSAANAGVSVATAGECAPADGGLCGGLLGAACEAGQFCDFPPEAICGAADQTGVCRVVPEVCTQDIAPVCGCDDQTYANACLANVAGISVASQGACP